MANFYGKSFIFNDIPSENYGLFVINFGSSSTERGSAGAGIEIFKQEIYRRPKPYFFGVSQRPVLEFDFVFGSEQPLSAEMRSLIESWLLGQTGYKKLQIVQDDLINVYFNCFIDQASITYVGNVGFAYECKVICDTPWGWEYPKTLTYTYPGGVANQSVAFLNRSANNDYLYPILDFTISPVGSGISISNTSDNSRAFTFTGLTANSIMRVDNDLKIITSSNNVTNVGLITKFNKNWFRLLPGVNNLLITGGISSLTMTYQFAKKVGG